MPKLGIRACSLPPPPSGHTIGTAARASREANQFFDVEPARNAWLSTRVRPSVDHAVSVSAHAVHLRDQELSTCPSSAGACQDSCRLSHAAGRD